VSQENVEIVRGYFDARRAEGREAVFKFLARDVRWEARADFPDAGVYVGHNGVREFFERFRPVLGEMWFEPDEFIAVGERVVVPLRWGRSRGRQRPRLR
jgi:ketosteroid isomerase-like protein